jgi:Ca2+/Na+ antiporter
MANHKPGPVRRIIFRILAVILVIVFFAFGDGLQIRDGIFLLVILAGYICYLLFKKSAAGGSSTSAQQSPHEGDHMAIFKIYGADEQTGRDTTVTIAAASPDEAEVLASYKHILINRIVEVEQTPVILGAPQEKPSGLAKRVIPEAKTTSGQVAQGVVRAVIWILFIGLFGFFVVFPFLLGLFGF